MLAEVDRQMLAATGSKPATHAIVPVGAGCIAQAVSAHYASSSRAARGGGDPGPVVVAAVEPDTAACLYASVGAGCRATVPTAESIMCGLNCGTLSTTA